MNRLLILIMVLLVTSCGSVKKIKSFNKGAVIVKSESRNNVSKQEDTTIQETLRGGNSKSATINESVVREIIFNDRGEVDRIKETSNKESKIDSYEEYLQVLNELKSKLETDSSVATLDSTEKTETEDLDLNKSAKNPVWNWIGGALLICIVGFFAWKVILKR